MIYLSLGTFFFLLNLFTDGPRGDWWFVFPMLPLGLILAFHFIFSIGKDYMQLIAARWEAQEQGRSLDEYLDSIEGGLSRIEPEEKLHLRGFRGSKLFKKEFDEDFV
jgi:hypothetical protein